MKTTLTSPGFPRFYPDNMNCVTFIVAPNGYRILIEFEELVLEHEPQCTYDYLEMFEPSVNKNSSRFARHNRGIKKKSQQNLLYEVINGFPSIHQQQQLEQLEFQQLLRDYLNQRPEAKVIFQPSNATYNTLRPPPSTISDRMPRKMCGDWSSKLKLLRHRTKSNLLGIRFSSDYSHHFSGFKAKISLEKGKNWNRLSLLMSGMGKW
jgi:CUB domain